MTQATSAHPMFPLGTVLFPGEVLPLRVFEPRYRALVDRCLADESQFGVTLIERGFEVGGDDIRTMVGTLARIVEAKEIEPGQWALLTMGTERIKVDQWLPDDPHPLARLQDFPESPLAATPDEVAASAATAGELLRRCFDIAAVRLQRPELAGGPELPADPQSCSWVAAAAAPLTSHDRQRLLEADNAEHRLTLLCRLLTEHLETVELMGGLEP